MSSTKRSLLEVEFMRHGLPVGGRRYRGSGCDDPLSDSGWLQMFSAMGDGENWEGIVTSPLRRALDFADFYGNKEALPVTIEPRFREIGMGRWEGLSPEEVKTRYPDEFMGYYKDPEKNRPSGGENLTAFCNRVYLAMENLPESSRPILVIAHAGVIRAALSIALDGSNTAMMRVPVGYACRTRFRKTPLGWTIVSMNNPLT